MKFVMFGYFFYCFPIDFVDCWYFAPNIIIYLIWKNRPLHVLTKQLSRAKIVFYVFDCYYFDRFGWKLNEIQTPVAHFIIDKNRASKYIFKFQSNNVEKKLAFFSKSKTKKKRIENLWTFLQWIYKSKKRKKRKEFITIELLVSRVNKLLEKKTKTPKRFLFKLKLKKKKKRTK